MLTIASAVAKLTGWVTMNLAYFDFSDEWSGAVVPVTSVTLKLSSSTFYTQSQWIYWYPNTPSLSMLDVDIHAIQSTVVRSEAQFGVLLNVKF